MLPCRAYKLPLVVRRILVRKEIHAKQEKQAYIVVQKRQMIIETLK